MKKFLSVILIVSVLFSLSACTTKEKTEGPAPEESAEASAPASSDASEAPEVSEDAEPKRVLAVWLLLSDTTFQMMSDMMGELFEQGGYVYDAVSSEGDPLLQLEQIENGVVQGYDLIFVIPINGDAIADACQAAMDAGIYVYAFMNDPKNSTVFRTVDCGYAAEMQVKYAAAWVDETFPDAKDGEINTALIGQNYDSTTALYWETMQAEVKKYPKLNVIEAVTIEESIADGQAKAENILTMHPDIEINLWICASSSGLIGINAAIMAENSGIDYYDRCCLVGDVINEELANMLRLSVTNESVLRYCAAKGGRLDTNLADAYAECDKLLRGESVEAYSPVNVDLVTPDNLALFGY